MDADGNGTVTIMFNYTADDDRAWFENIADTGGSGAGNLRPVSQNAE